MFNYINSWKSRKSEKWNIEVRLGRITLLQLNYDAKKAKFRFMLLNFGLESEDNMLNFFLRRVCPL